MPLNSACDLFSMTAMIPISKFSRITLQPLRISPKWGDVTRKNVILSLETSGNGQLLGAIGFLLPLFLGNRTPLPISCHVRLMLVQNGGLTLRFSSKFPQYLERLQLIFLLAALITSWRLMFPGVQTLWQPILMLLPLIGRGSLTGLRFPRFVSLLDVCRRSSRIKPRSYSSCLYGPLRRGSPAW